MMKLVLLLQDLCSGSWLGVTKRINMPELSGHAHGVEMTSILLQLQETKK